MLEKSRIDAKDEPGQICPFLGLQDDSETALSFSSPRNRCYHVRPSASVRPEQQSRYCLTAAHTDCEEYHRESGSPLPPNLIDSQHQSRFGNKTKAGFWAILGIIVILIAWQVLSHGLFGHAGRGHSQANMPALMPSANQLTVLLVPTQLEGTLTPADWTTTPLPSVEVVTMTPTITPTLTPTFTPTLELPHALETPIGTATKFLIHRIARGESLVFLAEQYRTTEAAIRSVNYFLPTPIWVGYLVIIPLDQTDVENLPVFEAYQVTGNISVEDLARQLLVDPGILENYNGLQDAQIVTVGEWLLVPHNGTATP